MAKEIYLRLLSDPSSSAVRIVLIPEKELRSATISPDGKATRLRNDQNTRPELMTIHMVRYHAYQMVKAVLKDHGKPGVKINQVALERSGLGKSADAYAKEHGLVSSKTLNRKYQGWKDLTEETVHCQRASHIKVDQARQELESAVEEAWKAMPREQITRTAHHLNDVFRAIEHFQGGNMYRRASKFAIADY